MAAIQPKTLPGQKVRVIRPVGSGTSVGKAPVSIPPDAWTPSGAPMPQPTVPQPILPPWGPPSFPILPPSHPAETPASKAEQQLHAIDARCTKDLKTLDAEIARRKKGENWIQQATDPTLRRLESARAEIARAQKDCQAAESDLAFMPASFDPLVPMRVRMHLPEYGKAEGAVNDLLGRLSHAQDLLQGVALAPGARSLSGVRQVLGDLGMSQSQATAAQRDVWQGEDQGIMPVMPIDPILRRPLF